MQQRYYRAARAGNSAYQKSENEQTPAPQSEFESPALLLGKRIKKEQGRERAYEFLGAMEPFLAQGERELIASQLGVAMPDSNAYSRGKKEEKPPVSSSGGNSSGTDSMAGFLKLMQMMNTMQGSPAGSAKSSSGSGPDPAMLAKLMGMMK